MTNTAPIDYETALKEFLSARGWPEPIEADEETGSFVLRTGVNIGEHSGGRLIVHGTNSTGILRVYFYFPFRHKESLVTRNRNSEKWPCFSSISTTFGTMDGSWRMPTGK